MRPVECPHEQDVLDALAAGRWPRQCGEALRQHVAGCSVCADTALVTAALKDAGDPLWNMAHVPSSGSVWWRAQMRARRETARQAARPVTIAQGFGFAAALACLGALMWFAAPWAGLAGMMPGLPSVDLDMIRSIELPRTVDVERWRWIVFAAVGWIVLASLAIYFALLED